MSQLATNQIVVPVDFSDISFAAVKRAVRLSGDSKSVEVVHVLQQLSPNEAGVIWEKIDDAERATHAQTMLATRLIDEGLGDVRVSIRFGSEAQEIVDFAEEIGSDLIVISSHGRSGFRRFIVGSVAEKVVRLANCPVLVVKPSG